MLRQELNPRTVQTDLNQVVQGTLKCIEGAPGIDLSTNLTALPQVSIDPDQIQKVITNLLLNAYLSRNRPTIIARDFFVGYLAKLPPIRKRITEAISNVGIATVIYRYDPQWWIAGLGGALMGAVWNYVVSAAFVWRQR